MVICEVCASANNETDENCRVCGQSLKLRADSQTASTAESTSRPAAAAWAGTPLPQGPAELAPPSSLQVSAVRHAPQTGVPPMISQHQEREPSVTESAPTSVPGFMQSARTAGPQPEPVQLISASDLPDWIKQIAAADDAKAAAEAEAEAEANNAVESAATMGLHPLPGDTHVGGPPTGWLSKSGAGAESSERWGTAETGSATWGTVESAETNAPAPEAFVAAPVPVFVPSSVGAHSYSMPEGRNLLKARTNGPSSEIPVYRRRSVQLLVLVALLAAFAILML